jgi:lipopolysaccharide export system permease protein
MKILERYILKENFKPFIVSLVVSTFVMLLDKIIDLLNLIIDKKLEIGMIAQIFGLSLPFMLALTIPMAVLLASIMSFGRLATDSELVAFKSCGINIYKLMKPTVIAALFISIGMVYFNNNILPETNHMLKNLMIKARYRRPVTEIKPGTFTTMKDQTIYAKEIINEELHGIIIYNRDGKKFPQTITAQRGQIHLSNGGNSAEIVLFNGEMHSRDEKKPDVYQVRSFSRYVRTIADLGYQLDEEGSSYRGDRELSSAAMEELILGKRDEILEMNETIKRIDERIQELEIQPERTRQQESQLKKNYNLRAIKTDKIKGLQRNIRQYQVEIHKKYALAFACLIFVLVGVPVGMMTKTSGIGMAFSVSSIVFLIYYGTLTLGEEMADRGLISPFLAMWISNFLFTGVGVYLIVSSVREMREIHIKVLFTKMAQVLKLK